MSTIHHNYIDPRPGVLERIGAAGRDATFSIWSNAKIVAASAGTVAKNVWNSISSTAQAVIARLGLYLGMAKDYVVTNSIYLKDRILALPPEAKAFGVLALIFAAVTATLCCSRDKKIIAVIDNGQVASDANVAEAQETTTTTQQTDANGKTTTTTVQQHREQYEKLAASKS